MTGLVLASGSPRRRELLAALMPDFVVEAANIPEPSTGDPFADATGLALEKARTVARSYPAAVVIGADTVVHDGRRDYGKPTSRADAVAMLRALRGRPHRVVTGVAVVSPAGEACHYSAAEVELTDFAEIQIAEYVASGRPLDKAGAYAIQDEDVPTVRKLFGCYCCVVGLPLWRLRAMLLDAGVACEDPSRTYPRCATCPERP